MNEEMAGIAKDGAITAVTAGVAKYMIGPAVAKISPLLGRIVSTGSNLTNPIPNELAQVIPGKGPFNMLGPPGSKDVFLTDRPTL